MLLNDWFPNIGRWMYSFCSKFLKNHIEKNRISSFSSINSYLHKTETGQWSCYIALTLDSFITGIFLYNMAGWLAGWQRKGWVLTLWQQSIQDARASSKGFLRNSNKPTSDFIAEFVVLRTRIDSFPFLQLRSKYYSENNKILQP